MNKTIAPGVLLRNGNLIQIKFRVARLSGSANRIAVSYKVDKYSRRVKDEAMALRAKLIEAAGKPGTDDQLLAEHLDQHWLDRLGVSSSHDRSLAAAVDAHVARYANVKDNTRRSVESECTAVLKFWGPHKMLSSFAHEHSAITDWLLTWDASERYRKKCGGRLKLLLEDARKDGIITTHPLMAPTWWRDMQPARSDHVAQIQAMVSDTAGEPAGKIRPYTDAEVDAILSTEPLDGRHDEIAMAWVGFHTGLRTGELMALAVEDVDIEARAITVNWNYTRARFTTPKSVREVPVPILDEILFILRRQIAKYQDSPLTVSAVGDIEVTRRFLFRNTNTGRPFTGDDCYWRFWKRHCERAGVESRGPYQMRHTFATNAIEVRGWDYRDLAKVMGHTDPGVTRARYVKAREDDARRLVERLLQSQREHNPLHEVTK